MQRLNKYLALQQGISRRAADELISKGRAAINGTPAILGGQVKDGDVVTVDGKPVDATAKMEYLILNKPVGYVCSRRAQGDSPTVYALLPKQYHHLKPTGRLDRNSSGLVLFTNDGDYAFQMTHPQFAKVKKYNVTLGHDLEPLHQQMISDYGVTLEDGVSQLMLERRSEENRKQWIVTMSEGRNRQIRRTFTALGYVVTKLHRTNFGPYTAEGLKPGAYTLVEKG